MASHDVTAKGVHRARREIWTPNCSRHRLGPRRAATDGPSITTAIGPGYILKLRMKGQPYPLRTPAQSLTSSQVKSSQGAPPWPPRGRPPALWGIPFPPSPSTPLSPQLCGFSGAQQLIRSAKPPDNHNVWFFSRSTCTSVPPRSRWWGLHTGLPYTRQTAGTTNRPGPASAVTTPCHRQRSDSIRTAVQQ